LSDPTDQAENALQRFCVRCGRGSSNSRCEFDRAPTIVTEPRHRETLPVGTLLDDRYEILSSLATGAYGTVYRGRHVTTGHLIGVKVLHPLPGDDHVTTARRFFREAAATARLGHPNTVRVFDFGQSDHGELFLAMELLRGTSVARRLRRYHRQGRVMTPRLAAMIGVGVLRSLGEAHSCGIIHRDLKPSNVILHEAGPNDLAIKVVDFGVARDATAPMTAPGTRIGTASHMSPEQVAGGDIDHRADLYSVGVLLYQCLTGTLPFEHANAMKLAAMHVTEPAEPLGNRVQALAGTSIERVVMCALEKDPALRWQSAYDMRRALLDSVQKEDLFMIDDAFRSSIRPVKSPVQTPEPAALDESPSRYELPTVDHDTLLEVGQQGDELITDTQIPADLPDPSQAEAVLKRRHSGKARETAPNRDHPQFKPRNKD